MNKVLIVLLLLAVATIGYFTYKAPQMRQDAILENILSRKSVRNYVEGQISDIQYEKILRAAMAAPSAKNMQPWEFIVIKDKETLAKLADIMPYGKMLKNASGAIIVLGNMEKSGELKDFWYEDAAAATENMLLEIEALGLGGVWIGGYPVEERIKSIKEMFNLPDNIIPFNIISIGYPDGSDQPKDKWKPENIHWEKY